MFRDEFVVKKRFLDERWSFNFFSREKMYGNELNHVYIHSFRSIKSCRKVSRGWGHLITWNGPMMGHLNSFSASGGGNNKNFPKIQMPGGLPRGGGGC